MRRPCIVAGLALIVGALATSPAPAQQITGGDPPPGQRRGSTAKGQRKMAE
jgi:hypothetical protein